MIVTIIIMFIFLVLGIILSTGRGGFLIAGYNTMPKEEKENIDTVALCKFMGKMMFAFSFSLVLWIISDIYEIRWLFTFGLLIVFILVIFTLVYVNTGHRFKKENEEK
ncbi:DUF3784 domain-containing protein [Alkalihalobacillus sp. LMS39]|uniref:DUF3784 domain-containing protein n=1 Tax=Alkalihalobacillus sp. LMS39 TaxID=2924032 RepID=UPI001FB3A2C4|nr:DUF3784 domain-containing protein [Alkalihalobacillus sp. LMS39]UOE95750.1 DUF3784 domain-containing protein [Alkalihalobacillus sp. LMS39]